LIDVVITNPIQANLVSWATFSYGVVVAMVAQMKEGFSCNYYPTKEFLFFAIEVFGCLHQLSKNFLHQCVNMAWIANSKGHSRPSLINVLFILWTKNVGGFAKNTGHLHLKLGYYCKGGFF
jgi:hypothetical protein